MATAIEVKLGVFGTQADFVEDNTPFCAFVGGRGCISADTLIEGIPIAEFSSKEVSTMFGKAKASGSFCKGVSDLYQVQTSRGGGVVATDAHRFLTPKGWLPLADLAVGDLVAGYGNEHEYLERERVKDYQEYCSSNLRQGDELPTPWEVVVLDKLRRLHNFAFLNSVPLFYPFLRSRKNYPYLLSCQHGVESHRFPDAYWDEIQEIRFKKLGQFYDISVPFSEHYAAGGLWHHNSGKTKGGAIKLLGLVGEQKVNAIVTAPTYPMLRDSTMLTCLETWPRTLITDHSKTEMSITLNNGSIVRFRSTDDPDRLRGPNSGVVWMDEAAQSELEAWQILLGTLREDPGKAFVTTTPRGYDWIYQEFVAKERPNYKIIHGRSQDNPYNPPEFVEWLRESYKADFALQEIEGEFVLVGGRCYFDIDKLKELLNGVKEGPIFKPYVVGRRYAAFIDPSGMGEDAHSLSVLDCRTGEFVVDYTTREHPEIFALNAYNLLCKYQHPLLGIENNGVGLAMVQSLTGLGYPKEKLIYQDEKKTKVGVAMTGGLRDRILVDLALGIRQGNLIVYSRPAIDELFSFINTDKGKPLAASGAHDDRVISMAGDNWVSSQVPGLFVPTRKISYASVTRDF